MESATLPNTEVPAASPGGTAPRRQLGGLLEHRRSDLPSGKYEPVACHGMDSWRRFPDARRTREGCITVPASSSRLRRGLRQCPISPQSLWFLGPPILPHRQFRLVRYLFINTCFLYHPYAKFPPPPFPLTLALAASLAGRSAASSSVVSGPHRILWRRKATGDSIRVYRSN